MNDQTNTNIEKLNQDLDLYIPADVTNDEEKLLYEKLFYHLRKIYFITGSVTKDEIKKMFTEFYHSENKLAELNKARNLWNSSKKEMETMMPLRQEMIYDGLDDILNSFETDRKKAEFLYMLEYGEEPDQYTDLSTYQQAIESHRQRIEGELDQIRQAQVQNYYGSVLPPDQVANRYMTGNKVDLSKNDNINLPEDLK